MNTFFKVFGVALVMGAANAGAPKYRTYQVVSSQPTAVYKSVAPAVTYAAAAPVAYASPVSYAAAPVSYAAAPVSYAAAAPAYLSSAGYYSAHAHHDAAPVALLSTAGKPKVYSSSIPAAAVRNVETVMVTKTITPVVTKTTTHHTRAEPALSIGHVQGYHHGAVGHAKIAPVKFNTQYTTYANPTVGINGPVAYTGIAVAPAAPVAAAPVAVAPEPVAVKTAAAVVAQPAYYQSAAVVSQPAYYKTAAVAAEPAYYKTATVAQAPAAYSVYPGSALSLSTYGIDAYSAPTTNFIELRSGKPVFASSYKK